MIVARDHTEDTNEGSPNYSTQPSIWCHSHSGSKTRAHTRYFYIKGGLKSLISGENSCFFSYPSFFFYDWINCMLNGSYTWSEFKQILHLVPIKNIIVRSIYNWFKLDIYRLLRPLTVTSITLYKAQTAKHGQSGNDSKGQMELPNRMNFRIIPWLPVFWSLGFI